MSIVERKINIVNTPIELIVYLVRDISSDYVSMDEYMKTWIYDIYENKIFNYLVNKNEEIKWENTMPPLYDKHIDIIKYLIFKTTKSINKYLSFFMCISVQINPWIIYSAITPLYTNPLGETPIPIDNHRDFVDNFLGIQYFNECPNIDPQPRLLMEWYNQVIFDNSTPVCIKFKYLNIDFFFRIKYSKEGL